jgi:hypothetical protein
MKKTRIIAFVLNFLFVALQVQIAVSNTSESISSVQLIEEEREEKKEQSKNQYDEILTKSLELSFGLDDFASARLSSTDLYLFNFYNTPDIPPEALLIA